MSLSRPEKPHSSTDKPQGVPEGERYYIGTHKPQTEITRMSELHWTEQIKLKPKDTKVRPYRETGDFDTRIDIDRI